MKKLMVMILCGSMALGTIGCTQEPEKVESEKEVIAETSDETTAEPVDSESTSDDSTVGEVIEEEGMRKEPVVTQKELNTTGTTGPINYTLEAVQVSKLTATTQEVADLFGIEKDKEVTLIAVAASAENTSEETISFYLGQATLTSNTKEQVENDMFLGEYIDGEFLGQVVHSGTLVYILKNSIATDVTSITLHIDAPVNENWDNVGEEVTVDLTFQ